MSFDPDPATSLSGCHMRGMVKRRFLVSYPVEPSLLEPFVPPGGELSLHGGKAWLSDCFVHMRHMRPSWSPQALGLSFHYLIHRTRAVLPFPDGVRREAVLILDPWVDSRLLATFGSIRTGISFKRRPIDFVTDGSAWRIAVRDGSKVVYEAMIRGASFGDAMPTNSPFESAQKANDFLLGVTYGGSWDRNSNMLHLLAETHDSWQARVGTCDIRRHALLESLGVTTPRADHIITMVDCPHYFGAKSHRVTVAAAAGASGR